MSRIALALAAVLAFAAPALADCIGHQPSVQAPSTPAPSGQVATTTPAAPSGAN